MKSFTLQFKTGSVYLLLLATLSSCNNKQPNSWGVIKKDLTTFEVTCFQPVSYVDSKPVDRKFCLDKKFPKTLRETYEGKYFACEPLMDWQWRNCNPNPLKVMQEEGEALRRDGVIP